MAAFLTRSGDRISYRLEGEGAPVLLVPGGPGRDADHLEGLGGLARHAGRRLITMEPRGTGNSPRPASTSGYAATQVADDLEDLRLHLHLPRMDLIAHSAGCTVAFIYAAAHPERISRMVLITPSTRALGITAIDEDWERLQAKRRHEPWFADAVQALEEIDHAGFTPELRQRFSPLLYGAWTERARTHAQTDAGQRNLDATEHFHKGLPDASALRDRLGDVTAPVRIIIGELDLAPGPKGAKAVADLFEDARVASQDGAGHFPWVDDPVTFTHLATSALTDQHPPPACPWAT